MATTTVGALVLAAFLRSPDLPSRVAHDFLRVRDGALLVGLRTDDPATLEAHFADQGLPFPARVRDLRNKGYRLRGGRAHTLAGRPSALVVYRGPEDALLVCQTVSGAVSELPAPEEKTERGGLAVSTFHREASTQVFWQSGSTLNSCVSAGDPQELAR